MRSALVVGSGAIGLRTAVELLRRGCRVAVVAPVHPLHQTETSQGAGGLWMPFHCDDPRVDRWAIETLDELHPMALDPKNTLVENVPCVSLKQQHTGPTVMDFTKSSYDQAGGASFPAWTKDKRLDFQHCTSEMLEWQNTVFKYRIPSIKTMQQSQYNYAWLWKSPIVDSPKMLTHLLEEIQTHDNTFECNVSTGKVYTSVQEMVDEAKAMDCDTVINCTGLGARALCGDHALVGARGILLHFDRNTVQWNTAGDHDAGVFAEDGPWAADPTEPCYMIPRGDTIVVGGSYIEGDDREGITPEERQRLLDNARLMGINVDASPPVGEWTGFRPARPMTKCEIDDTIQDVTFVHSYGHGGSGWTVNVGVARETADLLKLNSD